MENEVDERGSVSHFISLIQGYHLFFFTFMSRKLG